MTKERTFQFLTVLESLDSDTVETNTRGKTRE